MLGGKSRKKQWDYCVLVKLVQWFPKQNAKKIMPNIQECAFLSTATCMAGKGEDRKQEVNAGAPSIGYIWN